MFWLSAVLYLLPGLLLYFLPEAGLPILSVSPVWAARVAGGVLVAWGLQLLLASGRPSGAGVAGLAAANLLVAATLVPAVLRGAGGLPAALNSILLGYGVLLALLGLLGLLLPRPRVQVVA